MTKPTTIAFYLPQFYPTPENDAWYGTGFTEWRNVAKAAPLFEEHYQPRLPADLGFYDLRLPEVRERQAALAKAHGIDAFCYYHYWFEGHRPLDLVIDELLEHSSPDIPFCLAWANENWSRHWDASSHEILLRQTYSDEDDRRHGEFLLRALQHPLYLRVNGRPILFLYRPQAMPDAARTIAGWRALWREHGLEEVEIVTFHTHGLEADPELFGADSGAQFVPHNLPPGVPVRLPDGCTPGNVVIDYPDAVEHYSTLEKPAWRRYDCVTPGWDNTPRRGDGKSLLMHGSTPELYETWLRAALERAEPDGVVLINAWNEWAEGAYLEPDLRHGDAYLKATARAMGLTPPEPEPVRPPLSQLPFNLPKRFADLYLDSAAKQALLQRRLSRLEATLERRIEQETAEAQVRIDASRKQALEMADEITRLRSQLAEISPVAPADAHSNGAPTS